MAGEDEEIAADVLYIDRHVLDALRAVDEDAGSDLMRHARDLGDRHDGADGVRHLRHGDEPGAAIDERGVFVHTQIAVVVDLGDAQPRAGALCQHLPRHDIGVMLQFAEDDLVIGADRQPPKACGHEVDGLGGAARENDLLGRSGAEEFGDLVARFLIGVGGAGGERVGAAMDVGIVFVIEARDPFDDLPRFLRRRGVVEPDERLAVHPLLQDRKIAARAFDVEPRRRRGDGRRPRGGGRHRRDRGRGGRHRGCAVVRPMEQRIGDRAKDVRMQDVSRSRGRRRRRDRNGSLGHGRRCGREHVRAGSRHRGLGAETAGRTAEQRIGDGGKILRAQRVSLPSQVVVETAEVKWTRSSRGSAGRVGRRQWQAGRRDICRHGRGNRRRLRLIRRAVFALEQARHERHVS